MIKNTLKILIAGIMLAAFLVPLITPCFSITVIHDKAGKVERAGIILIKKYGKGDYAVIVGEDKNILKKHGKLVVSFTAGGCERKDKYTTVTASRETKEETNNNVIIQSKPLTKAPSIFNISKKALNNPNAGGIQLFVQRVNNVSVNKLNQDIKKGIKRQHGYGEMSAFYAIPLKDLMIAAKKVANAGFPHSSNKNPHPAYRLLTRGDGKGNNRTQVYFQGNYLRAIAKNIKEFEAILANQTVNGKRLGTKVTY